MPATTTEKKVGPDHASRQNRSRFGLILVSIAATYVLASAIDSGPALGFVLAAQIATVWLVFKVSDATGPIRIIARLLLLLGVLAAVGQLVGLDETTSEAILFAAAGLLYLIAPISIARHVIPRKRVDAQTLMAAIAAYLLIGMFFAFTFRLVGAIDTAPFFGEHGDGTMTDNLFFSFSTLMTIGYGNLVPVTWVGQTLAVAEGLIGSLFLVVAVAKVVASWRPSRALS